MSEKFEGVCAHHTDTNKCEGAEGAPNLWLRVHDVDKSKPSHGTEIQDAAEADVNTTLLFPKPPQHEIFNGMSHFFGDDLLSQGIINTGEFIEHVGSELLSNLTSRQAQIKCGPELKSLWPKDPVTGLTRSRQTWNDEERNTYWSNEAKCVGNVDAAEAIDHWIGRSLFEAEGYRKGGPLNLAVHWVGRFGVARLKNLGLVNIDPEDPKVRDGYEKELEYEQQERMSWPIGSGSIPPPRASSKNQ